MTITQFAMAHDKDPADVIREEVGDLSKINVFHNLILVGIYKRPEKTKGGIIITQKSADEERFQGVVGLVLKVGPTAFRNDANNDFAGQTVEPGMWCVYRTSDTHKVSVNGVVCRLLEDAHVKMVVDHPDRVL